MLPILYSRRIDGGVQEWEIEVKDNQFRTHTRVSGGNNVISAWTTCQGKSLGRSNETTPEQQAEAETRSIWQKKVDSGYKTDIADIDTKLFFEPMLAQKYENCQHEVQQALKRKEMVFVQPKLDGMRCILHHTGLMQSRQGKPILSAPHIAEQMRRDPDDTDWVMDGELYADKFADDFNKIISLAKKTKPSAADLAASAEHLQYHVYDLGQSSVPFGRRIEKLRRVFKGVGHKMPSVRLVETFQVTTLEEIQEKFGEWLSAGYEGAMIRLDRPYESGKRSKFLLKYKQFQEEEFTIIDVLEGRGNRSGMAGKMAFKTASGRPFQAALKGNIGLFCRYLTDRKKLIGKVATVQFQNYTPDGSPRFPCVKAVRNYE